jgi:hypothetical protein
MVKRELKKDRLRKVKRPAESGGFFVTRETQTEEEALKARMKSLNFKLFGFINPVPYTLKSHRKVYMPWEIYHYRYSIQVAKDTGRLKHLNRRDSVVMVFDMFDPYGFYFDQRTDGLDIEKKSMMALDGELIAPTCTIREATKRCTDMVRYSILRRIYARLDDLSLVAHRRFLRPCLELVVEAKGREFVKHAYMDMYGTANEMLGGLKARIQ